MLLASLGTALLGQSNQPSASEGFDPNVNGVVNVVLPQSGGKVILGGAFTTIRPNNAVDNVDRNYLARVNADGTLDFDFDPNANGQIFAMAAQSDGKIIVGGAFTTISGVPRNRIARLNTNGSLDLTFDPNLGGGLAPEVYALLVLPDDRIVVGGSFTTVGGVTRNRLARLAKTGALEPFNPNANGAVLSLARQVDGSLLIGGSFTTFQPTGDTVATARRYLARFKSDTLDSTFDPRPDNTVHAIAVQTDGAIVIGGTFGNLQPGASDTATPRSRIARLDSTGAIDAFYNPNAGGQVSALVLQPDGRLLLAGAFTSVFPSGAAGASGRTYIARLNVDGTVDSNFNVFLNGAIQTIALQPDGRIVAGGYFTQLRTSSTANPVNRNRVARLNADGTPDTTLDPAASGLVLAQAVQTDGKVVLVGSFTVMGGLTRTYIARLNLDGSVDTTFAPNINNPIFTVAIQADQKILIGGTFTNIGGVIRNNVARLKTDGTLDSTFDPNTNGQVTAIAVQADQKVIISGAFTGVTPNSGTFTARGHFARFATDGTLDTAFNPNADSAAAVITIQTDQKILLGGSFTAFAPNAGAAVRRPYGARLNPDGTVDTSYYPLTNGPVVAQVIQGDGKIVIAGSFSLIAPKESAVATRYFIARLNSDSSLDTGYNPRAGGMVNTLSLQADGAIVAGGLFTFFRPGDDSTKNADRSRLARIKADGTIDAAFDPHSSGQVSTVLVQPSGKILVGGGFTALQPAGRDLVLTPNRYVRLNADGTVDPTFDPSATTKNGGSVETIVVQPDGKLVVAGAFSNFGGSRSANLARFTATGEADPGFLPNADGPVATVLVQPVRTTVPQANVFAWFNRDSTLRASFNAAIAVSQLVGQINAILVQSDGKIILAGSFTNKAGTSGNYLVRLKTDGNFDPTFDPQPAGTVNAIVRQSDGKFVIGGSFDSVAGVKRYRLARLNTDGKLDTSYDPYPGDTVYTLAIQDDDKVIVGGAFTTFQPNGDTATTARTYLARLNTDGKLDTAYNPTPSAAVRALAIQPDGNLVVGGDFVSFQPNSASTTTGRAYIARLTKEKGELDTVFVPTANGPIYAITLQPADGKPIIGGAFTVLQPTNGGTFVRPYVARLNTDGSVDSNFNPGPNSFVRAIAVASDGTIVLGGSFTALQPVTAFNAVARNHLALVGSDGALSTAFNPGPAGDVLAVVAPADGSVLVGGSFTSLAADANLIVGGSFANIGGSSIANLAQLDANGNVVPTFAPNPNGPVAALVQQADTKLIVGGSFTNIGVPRNRLARLATDGTVDTNYSPNFDGAVSALALQPADGKLIVGGTFNNVGATPRSNLARLNSDGTLDPAFSPATNGQVSALLLRPDGKIVVAGSFTAIGGVARNRLARLNSDGTLDPAFNPNVNGPVVALVASVDGKLIFGGTFTSVGSAGRNNVARLNADGTLDATFDPGADASVLALALQGEGSPVLGGLFNTVTGQARYRLARLGVGTTFATQKVSASADRQKLTWTRGGSSPEVSAVRFEFSTDAITWTTLGTANRVAAVPANWELTGLALPASTTFYVRATGTAPTSKNSSSGLLRSEQAFNFAVTPVLGASGTVGAAAGKSFRYVTADGTAAVYSAIGLPAGLSIDSATGLITGTPTETGNFAVTITASNAGGNVSAALTLSVGTADPAIAGGSIRLINLSARAQVAANGTAITGFNSSGGAVLIRAIGPGLTGFGVGGALADPVLKIYSSTGALITENNDWSGNNVSTTAAATGAFPLTVGSKDAALVLNLDAGGYTAQVTDAAGRGGVVLTEVYDANGATVTPRFSNLSTRAPVAPGAPLVGGFVITAANGAPATQHVLIRAVGPGIAKFGVTNALADPVLKVYDSAGALIATNDNWNGSDVSTAAAATGAFALDAGSRDAALLLTLTPGGYTFEITGANGTTGEALADIYAAP